MFTFLTGISQPCLKPGGRALLLDVQNGEKLVEKGAEAWIKTSQK